jgi:hypothetical protein
LQAASANLLPSSFTNVSEFSIQPIAPNCIAFWGDQFAHFSTFLFACVCAQSEPSGPEKASIELQAVVLEYLGTAAKLAVHLAQVSQVDHVT